MTTAPVVTITDEIIAELEQLSEMATPGPWHYAQHDDCQYVAGPCDEFICTDGDHVHDIQFIVATNPQIVAALLAERASLLAEIEKRTQQLRMIVRQHMPLEEMEDMPGWSQVVDAEKAIRQRNEVKEKLDRIRAMVTTDNESKESFIDRVRSILFAK